MFVLTPLVSAIIPFVIWPIELLLPYPYIIEEAAKAFLVLGLLPAPGGTSRLLLTLASAAMFTISETVLYMLNVSLVGDLSTLFTRLILTFLLHSVTMLILLFTMKKRMLVWPIGITIAILIHYAYNVVIGPLG